MLGNWLLVDIYAQAEAGDDAVGGSSRSDSLRYAAVRARIASDRVSADFRAQGLELPRTVRIVLWPDKYDGCRVDDIVVPRSGPWASQRLRVTGVQRSSLPAGHPRAHIQLTAVHSVYADREE